MQFSRSARVSGVELFHQEFAEDVGHGPSHLTVGEALHQQLRLFCEMGRTQSRPPFLHKIVAADESWDLRGDVLSLSACLGARAF